MLNLVTLFQHVATLYTELSHLEPIRKPLVILSEAKNLAVETLRCAQGDRFSDRLLVDESKRLDSIVSRHEADIANLRERVARLEESRQTLRAEVESELLKAVRQIEKNTESQRNELRRTLSHQTPALPSSPQSSKKRKRR